MLPTFGSFPGFVLKEPSMGWSWGLVLGSNQSPKAVSKEIQMEIHRRKCMSFRYYLQSITWLGEEQDLFLYAWTWLHLRWISLNCFISENLNLGMLIILLVLNQLIKCVKHSRFNFPTPSWLYVFHCLVITLKSVVSLALSIVHSKNLVFYIPTWTSPSL